MRLFSRIAYHGSRTKFDKFDVSFMGTGEGSQVHGWGIYLAEDKSISEEYRDALSDWDVMVVIVDDKGTRKFYVNDGVYDVKDENGDISENDPYAFIASIAIPDGEGITSDMQNLLPRIKENMPRYERNLDYIETHRDTWFGATAETVETALHEMLPNIKEIYGKIISKNGMLATVEIPDDLVFAEEDESIDKQPQQVIEALKQITDEDKDEDDDDFVITAKKYDIPRTPSVKEDIKVIARKYIPSEEFIEKVLISAIIFLFNTWNSHYYGTPISIDLFSDELKELVSDGRSFDGHIYEVPENVNWKDLSSELFDYVNQYSQTEKIYRWGSFEDFYNYYCELESPEEISLRLESLGVNGIHYVGEQDGSCYVVFNPEHLKITNKE